MKIYRLDEASEKKIKYINRHPNLNDDEKEKIIDLYIRHNIPDNIIDWNIFNSYSFDELKEIAEEYLKDREEKRNKKNLSKAIEGRDYIKLFENTTRGGTEYLYLPLTWVGSKYLASDHFLPKIKVPSKVMNANDFSDNNAKNDDLSPGAKWCISLWTLPDCVVDKKPVTDENGKELRHEGKRYWLSYTSQSYYFLFYFRDNKRVKDINKKIALTLVQGSSKIEDITLADDTKGRYTSVIDNIQYYWDDNYQEYISQIEHIQEVSKEEYPKFREYEKQKEQKAIDYYNSQRKKDIFRNYFTYNDSTERYDSKGSISKETLKYLVEDGEFIVPLGVINGDFDCSGLGLTTLKNGPTEVKGDFLCYFNRLTTLEGTPQKVGGNFHCNGNDLTTLEYIPKEVGGSFDFSGNRLTTLKGAPEYVGGAFFCERNNLTTLEYAPKEVGGSFSCYKNKLTTLKGSPKTVGENFDCSNNDLTTLEGSPKEVGRNFNCSDNKLTTLKYAPKKVGGDFQCSWNNLTTLEGVPQEVGGSFYCPHNNLTTLRDAPKTVGGNFHCRDNPLQSKELSTNVKGFIYYY